MLEVVRQDYVRTARAKGLSGSAVTRAHMLKNALIPVITVAGMEVGYIFGGAFLIEAVFYLPGIASYALLTHMVAQVTGLKAGEFVHTLGDAHLYLNHLEQADLQLQRKPKPLPRLVIRRDVGSLFDFRYEDFEIVGYEPDAHIRAPVAV